MSTSSSDIMRELAWELARETNEHPKRKGFVKPTLDFFRAIARRAVDGMKIGTSRLRGEISAQPSVIDSRNRFMEAVKRIELCHAYAPTITPEAPYGYFRGRPIIGESTRVNGGIFVGALPQEAIVVDAKYGAVDKLVKTLIQRCKEVEPTSANFEYEVFSKAVTLTRETLRYSEEGVAAIEKSHHVRPDDKVTLDVFIKRRVGVSRHQTLLAAFLLERLREQGYIKGQPSIEGAISPEVLHERLLFTSADGEVFRFDPIRGLGKTAIH